MNFFSMSFSSIMIASIAGSVVFGEEPLKWGEQRSLPKLQKAEEKTPAEFKEPPEHIAKKIGMLESLPAEEVGPQGDPILRIPKKFSRYDSERATTSSFAQDCRS